MAIHKPTFLINHEKFTQLYVTLMVFVLAEIYGFGDNFEEKYLFAFRFSLVSLHFLSLMYILITTLSHYSDPRRPGNDGGIVLIVVSMIIASATCILFVILISTIATIIICISWIVTISIVVVLRWNDIVHQMRIIIADVANKSFSVAASSSSNGKLIMKEGKTPKKLAANDLPYEEPTYSVSEHTERVIQVCILYLFLMTFVVAETSGFCDNFVEKHIFVMRFLLISTLTSFLMPILATAFEHPPGSGGLVQFVIIMALGCLMCVFEVHRISAITAIVTCILWIIVIFIVVKSRCATVSALMAYTIMKEGKAPENEVPTYSASDNFKSFMEVNDMICLLYFVLMAFVYLEASGCADMKSVLILTLLRFLIDIRATILEHPPPGNGVVLQFVIMMVMACSVYVLLVLPISTITALIAFILWAVVISTFVASRCNEILEQIRGIRTAVANMF